MRVELDGHERALWMIFIGNCRYHPHGFAPTWREHLDDGLLDVRLVDAGHPWARVRLLLAVLTGRLGRTAVYEERTTDTIRVHSLDGPLRLARDGETFDGGRDVLVGKESEPLAIYVPEREP
jgi:undecaprenyl-diphosphatase